MTEKKKFMMWIMLTAAISVGATAAIAGGIAAIRNSKKMKMLQAARTTGEVLCTIGSAMSGQAVPAPNHR